MSASTIPWWGKAYELALYTTPDGSGSPGAILTSSAWEPEALRMTFDISQSAIPSPWWFADICVYNMNDSSVANVLVNAQWVILKAGYQSTGAQTIWSGPVLQVLYEREDVVDYKVTFHCLATDPKTSRALNFNVGKQIRQAQVVAAMAGLKGYQLTTPVPSQLNDQKYIRGKTFFGTPDKYFGQIADSNYMQWFKTPQGVGIGHLDAPSNTPDIVYSSPLPINWQGAAPSNTTSYTIMGSPQQNDCGVDFEVLLDPRLIVKLPPLLVRIDNTIIRQITLPFPQSSFVMPLDADNSYVVAAVRHVGDTRGNIWASQVKGYSRAYTQGTLRGIFLTGKT